jgi:hypothetical protein
MGGEKKGKNGDFVNAKKDALLAAGTATNANYQLGRYFLTYLIVSKGNSASILWHKISETIRNIE